YPGFLGSRYFIYQANSDSTFLALLNKAQKIGEYHHLVEVNINTFVIDTLFSIQIKDNEYLELSAFAYNAKKQLLAISVYYDWENTLSIFDYSTDEKNLVYNTKLYETINGPSSIVMTEFMAWNEENDKLILVGNSVTGSWSAIDLFSLRDTSLNIISRVVDAPYGRLFEISWFDTTHIIYRDATYGGIYSHNIDIETSVKEEKNKVITDVLTLKNYPNPFNSFTNISFSLPAAGFINLVIYNLLGEKISEVSKDYFAAGTHTLSVDLAKVNSTLSSGIYIYTLKTSKQITSHKMVYLK
ncbi:MAG: T9SS type A sorting domain-containing protein, partial [Bacteroidetes bacterium]|nr:T9SS type A sorting domain-containing protein [Bacteroidota bacterium]